MAELENEAKELIRSHMLKLVVVPASVLSIVSFLLGWFINEGARNSAYHDAYGEVQEKVVEFASAAAVAATQANAAKDTANAVKSELDSVLLEISKHSQTAKEYAGQIELIKSIESELTDRIADQLIGSPEALAESLRNQLASDAERVGEIADSIRDLKDESKRSVARSVCYSKLHGNPSHGLILVPLPNASADLDGVCKSTINQSWFAGGVAKAQYFNQDCADLRSNQYGGGYTSFVAEVEFESNRARYSQCGPSNAYVCCSPQFSD